jgi:hypothetical protein
MKKQLEIKPVLRYTKAKYPKYTDPNPLDDPQALPYPFSKRMLDWATGIGLLGVTSACQGEVQEVANTFTINRTGLPYFPAMFGTGVPDPLPSKEIRALTLQVCKEEGLIVKEDVVYEISDNTMDNFYPIAIFDEEKKIGFAILNNDNTEEISLLDPRYLQFRDWPILSMPLLERMWSQFLYGNPEFSMDEWLDMENRNAWSKEDSAFYELFAKTTFSSLSEQEEEEGKWIFYKKVLEHFDKIGDKNSLRYHKKAIENALKQKNTEVFQQAIHLNFFIVLLHELVPEEEWNQKVMEQYIADQRSWLAQNPGKQSAASNVLADLKDPYSSDSQVEKALQALFRNYHSNWKEILWDTREEYQKSHLNLEEIRALDTFSDEKKLFVAPISFEDQRFSYHFTEKELIERWNAPRGSENFQNMQQGTKEAALTRLEASLRAYIRWAKLQGGY